MIRIAMMCLVLFFAPLAVAEDIDLSGNWSIATSEQAPCSLTGKATLAPASSEIYGSDYRCEITMRHACEGSFEAVVRQSCKVRNVRGQITVQSTIVEHLVGEDRGTYVPDNFRLSAQSKNELYGVQIDDYGTLRATWTRATGSIS